MTKKSVLFICLGNICRSPIAEAIFLHLIKEKGVQDQWNVDSAALIDYHEGSAPDARARAVLKKHGISYDRVARPIENADYYKFDHILGMDKKNIEALNKQKPEDAKAKISLLGEYDESCTGEKYIRDPYYDTGSKGFEECYQKCYLSCQGFLELAMKGAI